MGLATAAKGLIGRCVQAGRVLAGYEAGKVTQRNAGWRPRNRAADLEISADYSLMTARGRWLGRNNPWCIGAKQTIVDNVLGKGIETRAAARDPQTGDYLEDWNEACDDAFRRFEDEADLTGRRHFKEMTRENLDQCIESGDGLIVESVIDPAEARRRDYYCELKYELIEPDQIDLTKDRPASPGANEIRRGVEVDQEGRIVAYHLYTQHPGGYSMTMLESERVPAQRVIHLARTNRPTQYRGVTWFAPIVTPLWNSYEYLKYEIDAAKVGSLFVYLWKGEHGFADEDPFNLADSNGVINPADTNGNPQAPLGPGIGLYGGVNDDLKMISAQRPNSQAVAWLRFLLQTMGVGIGLSYIRMTGDFSQTNFSSSRAADLQDRKRFEPLQEWHAHRVDEEIRKRVTRHLIATGRLTVPSGGIARFNRNPRRWLAMQVQPPGWGYVDPQKEVEADIKAISAGLLTFQSALSRRGIDWRQNLRQLAEEVRFAKDLGLNLGTLFGGSEMAPADEPGVEPLSGA